MPKPGDQQPSNAEIAERMRAFSKQRIETGFWGESNTNVSGSIKKTIYAPFWLQAVGVLMLLALFLFFNILLPSDSTEVPEPFRSNYVQSWLCFVILLAIGLYVGAAIAKYSDRRMKLFCEVNNFVQVSNLPKIPGDLRKDGLIKHAFHPAGPLGRRITFGRAKSWFDLDHKAPVTGGSYRAADPESDLECFLFVRVEINGLDGEFAYFSPDRPADRALVQSLSDQSFQALCELASRYAVVIGQNSILVSAAGGSLNSVAESLQVIDLRLESRWQLMQRIIGGKLASVVEGIS